MSTYQQSIGPITDTLAHYKAWGQFLGGGFTTCGWVAQTGHGELVASGTGASYAWTNVAAIPIVAVLPARAYTFKGAFVGGTTYVGGNTADFSTEVDVVTDGGLTYVHITATSNAATVPSGDATNWQPLNFEIWKSNGSNTAALPIYVRLVYTTNGAANNTYQIHMSIGTGVDSGGNITGAATITTVAPLTNISLTNSALSTATLGECDFSGDADNFRFILWRGGPVTTYRQLCIVDRAKTAAGADSDAFFWVGTTLATATASIATRSSIVFKSAFGSPVTYGTLGWAGTLYNGSFTTSLAMFGAVPVFPIFPIVGYLANPLLGAMCFNQADVTTGIVVPVWLYGANHNYLVDSTVTTATASPTNVLGSTTAAILWE